MIRAQAGYTVKDLSLGGFKPGQPWKEKDSFQLFEIRHPGETPKVDYSLRVKPTPLWHPPRFRVFESAPISREDVLKYFPELDQLRCGVALDEGYLLDAQNALNSLRELQASDSTVRAMQHWAQTGATEQLPESVTLSLPSGPHTFKVETKNDFSKSTLILSTELKGAQPWESFRGAAVFSTMPGPLVLAIQIHNGKMWARTNSVQLKDGQLMVGYSASASKPFTITVEWSVDHPTGR